VEQDRVVKMDEEESGTGGLILSGQTPCQTLHGSILTLSTLNLFYLGQANI